MTSQQSSWSGATLAVALLIYLFALFAFALCAPQYRINVQPSLQEQLPLDFQNITLVDERKQAFFDFLRPLVAHQNAYYQRERERLLAISAKIDAGESLSRSDRRKLDDWTETFAPDEDLTEPEKMEMLKRRINTIPESMVLAQAAIESSWGRSRFAREANNYFGQWCYDTGCGLVPERRNTNASHEVRKFDSIADAVGAYFLNINTHGAYRALRDERLALERAGEEATGVVLAGHLSQYSERGQAYVHELRQMIRGNALE